MPRSPRHIQPPCDCPQASLGFTILEPFYWLQFKISNAFPHVKSVKISSAIVATKIAAEILALLLKVFEKKITHRIIGIFASVALIYCCVWLEEMRDVPL